MFKQDRANIEVRGVKSRAVDCLFIETNSCSPEELHVRQVCYQTDFRKHKMLLLI